MGSARSKATRLLRPSAVTSARRPDRGEYPFAQIDANSLSEASFTFPVETAGSFAKKNRPRAQGLVACSVGSRSQQHVLTRVVAVNRSLQRHIVVELDVVRAALAAHEFDLYVIDAIGVSIDDAQHRGIR